MPLELTQSRVQKIWIPVDHRPSLPRCECRFARGPGCRGAARRVESQAIVWRALAGRCSAGSAPPVRSCRAGRRPPRRSLRAGAGRFPLLPAGGRVPSLRPRGGDGAGWGEGAAPPPAGVGGAVARPAAPRCSARLAAGAQRHSETPSAPRPPLRSAGGGTRRTGREAFAAGTLGRGLPRVPQPEPLSRAPAGPSLAEGLGGSFPTFSLPSLPPRLSAFLPLSSPPLFPSPLSPAFHTSVPSLYLSPVSSA